MRSYPPDPEFPKAYLTHAWSLKEARADNLSAMLHEFRKATEDQWAEWVAARTPYGEEARRLRNWQEERIHRNLGFPSTEELQSKQRELQDLLIRIDDHLHPPDPRSDAILILTALPQLLFNQWVLKHLIALLCCVWFVAANPSQWAWYYLLLTAPVVFGCSLMAADWATGFFVNRESNRNPVPGLADYRPHDVDLGGQQLSAHLDPIRLSRADEIIPVFGDWAYFQEKPSFGGGSCAHFIKFFALDPNLRHRTNTGTAGVWNVGSTLETRHEGPAVLFLYRIRRRSLEKDIPLALMVLENQTWRPEFFTLPSTPYMRSVMLCALLGIPVTALLCLLTRLPVNPNVIYGALPAGAAAYYVLRSRFDYRRRHAITDLAVREDYKQALVAQYVQLKHPEAHVSAGRL